MLCESPSRNADAVSRRDGGAPQAVPGFSARIFVRGILTPLLALALTACGVGLPPAALEPPAAQTPAPGDILATLGSPNGRHAAGVLCVAVNAAGTVIASGGADATVRLWDATTLRPLARIVVGEPTTRVTAVAFSGDGKTLAAALNPGAILLWDAGVSPPKQIGELQQLRFGANTLSISADGRWLAAGGIDAGPHLFDLSVSPPRLVPNLPRLTGTAHSVLFSPDSRTLAVDSGFEIQIWDVTKSPPTVLAKSADGAGSDFRSGTSLLSFSRDGGTLSAAGNVNETIRLWHWRGTGLDERAAANGRSHAAALSPDGDLLVVASAGGGRWHPRETYLPRVRLFDVSGGATKELDAVEAHLAEKSTAVTTIAFCPNGRTAVSGGEDGAVELWEVSTRRLLPGRPAEGTNIFVEAAAPSPDGRRLAVVGRSDSVFIWNLDAQPPVLETKLTVPRDNLGSTAPIAFTTNLALQHVAWSADGKTLAAVRARTGWSGGREAVWIWNLAATPPVLRAEIFPAGLASVQASSLALSPDGSRLALGTFPHVDYWEIGGAKPRQISLLHAITFEPQAIAFTPDGQHLLAADPVKAKWWETGGGAPTLRAELENRNQYRVPGGGPNAKPAQFSTVAFSAAGRTLVTGGWDGVVRLWEITGGKPVERAELWKGWRVKSVAVSADGGTVASSAANGQLVIGSTATKKATRAWQFDGAVTELFFLPDNHRLVTVQSDGTVKLLRVP